MPETSTAYNSGYSQDARDAKYAYQQEQQSLKPQTVTGGGFMTEGDGSGAMQPAAAPEETKTEENNDQTDSQEETRKFPLTDMFDLTTVIWGLPPVGYSLGNKMPHPVTGENGLMKEQDSVFMNSFPILTLLPVEVARIEGANGVDPKKTSPLTPLPYKFAIQNKGSVTYSLTNNYGEGMIEEAFNSFALKQVSDIYQHYKTSRLLNSTVNSGMSKLKGAMGNAFGDVKAGFGEGIDAYNNALNNIQDKDMRNMALNLNKLAGHAWNMIIGGQKIDIPNIWQGSSAPISQQVEIVLHSMYPDNDSDFLLRIVYPLQIIFALSAPYSKSKTSNEAGDGTNDGNGGGEGSGENTDDIISYENPPYLEAEIDGVFKSKLCAITSCNIDIPYNRFSLAKGGRPYVVNVQLTITDLYNTIVWNDTPNQYAPNGLDITNNLKNHTRDVALPEIDKSYMYYVVPNGGASAGGMFSGLSGLGNIANTIAGAASKVANAVSAVIGANASSISQSAYQVAQASGYMYYSDNKPLLTNELDRSNAEYNAIVDNYLEKHSGDNAISDSELQDKWNKILFEYDEPISV